MDLTMKITEDDLLEMHRQHGHDCDCQYCEKVIENDFCEECSYQRDKEDDEEGFDIDSSQGKL